MMKIKHHTRKNITNYTAVVEGEEIEFELEVESKSRCRNGTVVQYCVRFDLPVR